VRYTARSLAWFASTMQVSCRTISRERLPGLRGRSLRVFTPIRVSAGGIYIYIPACPRRLYCPFPTVLGRCVFQILRAFTFVVSSPRTSQNGPSMGAGSCSL